MTDTPRRSPRWMKALLIASLAGNLAVVGVIAGAALRGPIAPAAKLSLPIEGFNRMHRAMPAADQAALRADLRGRRDTIRAHRKQVRAARQAFLAALTAEPFSAAALTQALESQAQVWTTLGAETREVLVDRIEAMTPEARAEFAANLQRRGQRRAPQKRDKP